MNQTNFYKETLPNTGAVCGLTPVIVAVRVASYVKEIGDITWMFPIFRVTVFAPADPWNINQLSDNQTNQQRKLPFFFWPFSVQMFYWIKENILWCN